VTPSADRPSPPGGETGSGTQPGESLASFGLDAVSLFLFSAACGLTHRIHYDERYARSEGFDGLPVQGPLQGALIAQVFDQVARRSGRRLAALQIKHVSPAYAGQEFRLIPEPARLVGPGSPAEEIGFRLVTGSGTVVSTGTASLALASAPA
jgi:hydroxyacyl-ACP dehydratase HTD2-like protein with hotdog domain